MYQHNKCAIHWPSPHLNISLISENGDGSVCERRKLVSSFSYISSSGRILESKKRHFSTLQKDNSLNNSTPYLGMLTVAVPASALVSEYKINDLEQHDCLHLLKIHTSSPEQPSFAPMYTVHIVISQHSTELQMLEFLIFLISFLIV